MLSRAGNASLSSPDCLPASPGGAGVGEPLGRSSEQRTPKALLAQIVFRLDSALRRRQSIIEYTRDATCILRIKLYRIEADIVLADGSAARAGARIVDLHLWNEQIPPMAEQGASIAWARQMDLCFRHSLRELARYLAARPDLDDVALIRCTMAFGGPERNRQTVRMIGRYGFEPVPTVAPATLRERAHRFGENILISLMVLVRNAAALRRDTLRRGRTQVFLSRQVLEQRYGNRTGLGPPHRVAQRPDQPAVP